MNAPSNGFDSERSEPFDGFRVERTSDTGVTTITLDVPGKFNRVSMLARDQLAEVFTEADRDESTRFVVLTGAGGQFTAGGDIAGFLTKSPWWSPSSRRTSPHPSGARSP